MRALVKYAPEPGNMEIRDVPEPTPGPGQVKIKVVAAGICGSDLHIQDSDIAIPVRPPVVTGHEFSGVVAEVGEGVTDWKPGDRVVSETAYSYCGKCPACREGWYNLCPERKTLGYWFNGIFTNYTIVPEGRVHFIPEGVDDISAALTEPLACVCHAVFDLTVIKPTDLVVVNGPGPMGLLTVQVVKSFGAKVLVSGTNADVERLALAKELGADYVVNINETPLETCVNELTNGVGADVVMECSGNQYGINGALKVIKRRGYFTMIGMGKPEIPFNVAVLNYREPIVTGSLGSRKASWEQALDLLGRGKVKMDKIATHVMPLADWEKAFGMFRKKEEGVKFVLKPFEEDY